MKKYLFSGFFIFLGITFGFSVKAQTADLVNPIAPQIMGFADGNMYNPLTGKWMCMFLMDGNCYDVNQNILATRTPDSILPAPATQTAPAIVNPDTLSNTPIIGGSSLTFDQLEAEINQERTRLHNEEGYNYWYLDDVIKAGVDSNGNTKTDFNIRPQYDMPVLMALLLQRKQLFGY